MHVFAHNTYFEGILLELRINSYKVGINFATYRRMIAKWTSWAGTSIYMDVLTQLFRTSVMVLLKSHALKLKSPWLDFIVASLINPLGLDLLYL